MNAGGTIGAIITLLGLAAIVLAAHYLAEIRNILREMRETQKQLAARMGVAAARRT